MRRTRRKMLAVAAAAALVATGACGGDDGGDDSEVEVFSWWTGPGEEEGLHELIRRYEEANDGAEFLDAAVAGGGGEQARAILASRMQSGDPPDSFQGPRR